MSISLDLLNDLQVASPCTADWDEMAGDDHVRFCGECAKNVFNLSSLTSDQALALIRQKEGDLCGRFFRRRDGTILTADCPVGVHHRIRRKRRSTAFVAALAGLVSFNGFARCDDGSGPSTSKPSAKQEKLAKPGSIDISKLKFELVLGWVGGPLPAPIPKSDNAPEQLPLPREARID